MSTSSSTQDFVNVNTSEYDADADISIEMMKKKLSRVVFGSEDFRDKIKEGRADVEIISVTTQEEEEEEGDRTKTDATTDFQVYQIPSVESSARLPVRNQETDILVKR